VTEQKRHLITMDSRGRVSLAKLARPEDSIFIVTIEDDGVIVLTPATVVPKES
jgi:hypothetical protein